MNNPNFIQHSFFLFLLVYLVLYLLAVVMGHVEEANIPVRRDGLKYYKQIVFIGVIISTILWGSTSLITSIAYLRQSKNTELFSLHGSFQTGFDINFGGDDSDGSGNTPVYPIDDLPIWVNGKIRLNQTHIRDGTFSPSFKQVQWIKEPSSINNDKGTYVLKDNDEYLIKSIVDENYQISLFNGTDFTYNKQDYSIESLVASPDLTKAVIKTNSTHNWRWSSFSLYWVLDIESQEIQPLDSEEDSVIATVKWSPDSKQIAFIKSNNVYIRDLSEKSKGIKQITTDGGPELFYGKPDWVYEEEVFGQDIVLWWSPQGDKVAFLKTNDTLVPEYSIPYFVQDDAKYQDYPEFRNIKYPKAGYPNPIVNLVIHDIHTGAVVENEFTGSTIETDDLLITEVVWVSDGFVLCKTSNRASDLVEAHLINASTLDSKLVRTLKGEKNSWFEISANTVYVPKNVTEGRPYEGYIDTIVVDGFNHLGYFSPPENPTPKILTQGQWEVLDGVSSFDYLTSTVYFKATKKSSVERHIYSVNLKEALESDSPTEISSVTDTSNIGWFSGSFSSGSRYVLLNYMGPETPHQKIVDLHAQKVIKTLEENHDLTKKLNDYVIPESNYQVISLGIDEETGEEILANAVETLPINFDKSKKYPVLFFVYGGPGSQMVNQAFLVSFSQVVASQLDSIVVTVDGRGTGFNNLNKKLGSQFKFCVRDQLGYFEPRDQISAAKIWSAKPYVDSDRIAIWGWSYGGFLTLKTLETDSVDHVFSFGMSVAPVTKWKLYDSIYTERYMRKPQENPEGYETASIHDLSNFKNVTRFLIAHGSGDDNVHFQNSLKLIDELNLETIENFDFYVFPDSDHSIRYHNGNVVVYDRLLTWLKNAFKGEYKKV